MEFGLLGPLDIREGGRIVSVNSPKHRILLATLLVDADRQVPAGRLIRAVWGFGAPDNPRRALQLHITRLRALLNDAVRGSGAIIVTCPDGYRIDVAPDQVDLLRFRRGLAEADRAAESGDPHREAASLASSLAEWRGEALADVPSEFLRQDVVPELEEQRLQAIERRIAAEHRLGRHAPTMGELMALTAQHPLRERIWALLMSALDAVGRRSDALAAYQRLRRHLAEELGIDPSEELRALHATILAGRRRDSTAVATSGVLPAVPRQLPPDVRGFTGRADHLVLLDSLLPAADRAGGTVVISAIAGTAGIGKTALAVHWARRVADAFPDGQLYLNLRGYHPGRAVTTAEALTRFLRSLGVPASEIPLDPEEQTGLYRSMMDGRRMLVVLDNARGADHVRPLLPGAPGCVVVVTSRDQLSGLVAAEAVRLLTLDVLSTAEAHQMLAYRLGADRLAAEPEAVADIIDGCARLPLALALVAARAAAHPEFRLEALAAELHAARGGLDMFSGGDQATDVRAVFSWSYHTVGEAAARLFRLLGLHPGPEISAAAAAGLAGMPLDRARPLLAELTRANLITESAPSRFSFHDLLRAYAAELAEQHDTEADRQAAVDRMLDHYLHTGYTAALLLQPSREPITLTAPRPGVTPEALVDYDQAMEWFVAEHPVLVAMVDYAAAHDRDRHAWQLAWVQTAFLYRQGHWRDRVAVETAALAAARRLGDPAAQAVAHRNLAGAYTWMRRYREGDLHYRQALQLATDAGDVLTQAHIHQGLAFLATRQGRPATGLRDAERALALYRASGSTSGEAEALNQVGFIRALLGDHREALAHCRQALELHEKLGNRYGQAATLDSLGLSHQRLGDHAEAIGYYRRALELLRELGGERYPQAEVLVRIGDTHEAAGQSSAAGQAWGEALDILSDLDHPDAKSVRDKLRRVSSPS